jgi:hypothetical protein
MFTIFYVLFGVIYIFSSIANVANYVLDELQKKAMEKLDKDPNKKHVQHTY